MRTIIAAVLLTACGSDIALTPDAETHTVTNTVTNTITNTLTYTYTVFVDDTGVATTEDTGTVQDTGTIEPPPTCGFWVAENGAFGDTVYVESRPTFSLIDATTADPITHYQGEDADFDFAVTASPCGPIEILGMFIVVQDQNGNPWLYQVYQDGTGGVLEYVDANLTFNQVFARNMAVTPSGDELHYEWCLSNYGSAVCDGVLTQPAIDAGTQQNYTYKFTATHLTPLGEDYEIFISWVIWRDVITGRVITDYSTYGSLNRPVHCLQ